MDVPGIQIVQNVESLGMSSLMEIDITAKNVVVGSLKTEQLQFTEKNIKVNNNMK